MIVQVNSTPAINSLLYYFTSYSVRGLTTSWTWLSVSYTLTSLAHKLMKSLRILCKEKIINVLLFRYPETHAFPRKVDWRLAWISFPESQHPLSKVREQMIYVHTCFPLRNRRAYCANITLSTEKLQDMMLTARYMWDYTSAPKPYKRKICSVFEGLNYIYTDSIFDVKDMYIYIHQNIRCSSSRL